VLARHRGNATAAARQLGVSRTTLWRKLREYGIRRGDV
jgi:propionate catabolism operon transcriptional regulator